MIVVVGWTLWGRPKLWGRPIGEIDPLSAVIAGWALVFGIVSAVLAMRAWRWQETDTTRLLLDLHNTVARDEGLERQQLLGGGSEAIDIDFVLVPAPALNATHGASMGRLSDVVTYYNALRPRRLVITGEPGSGKTVLAVELILALLETRGPDDSVPVRLSASSLEVNAGETVDPLLATERVERWLSDHLVATYCLSAVSARALVNAGKVRPVIDGLDEMDADVAPGFASRAGVAVQIINAYQQHRAKAAVVITCRSEQFDALTAANAHVQEAVRVQIKPVTAAKACAFLRDRVLDANRWRRVLHTIQDARSPQATALSTPWRLTLAVTVYEQRASDGTFIRHPDRLTDPSLSTPEALRDHLLSHFIAAAAALANPKSRYKPPAHRVHRWLAVLAAYLYDNNTRLRTLHGRALSGTDIVLHELWPLAGPRRPRAVCVAIIAAMWLICILLPADGTDPDPRVGTDAAATALPFGLLAIVMARRNWTVIWPVPSRADFSRLRTREGLPVLLGGLVTGLALGITVGLLGGPVFGLTVGLLGGLVVGLLLGLGPDGFRADGTSGVQDPRAVVRNDLVFGLVTGLTLMLMLGYAIQTTIAFQLTVGLMLGLSAGPAGFRYFALLLCTRRWRKHWLPWRLGRLLHWSYDAGLLRIAGIGYQFRHRELQDYLVRNPVA